MAEGFLGFISGLIQDNVCDLPIKDVAVTITGISGTSYSTVEGLYIVGPLPAGTYIINFTKTGYTTKAIDNVRVDGINETFVDTMLVPDAGAITGKIFITANNQKVIVPGRIVSLTQKKNIIKTTTSNSGGAFTFSNISTGIYRVAARIKVSISEIYYDRSETIILMGGQTIAGVNLNLKLLHTLTGLNAEDVAIAQGLEQLSGN